MTGDDDTHASPCEAWTNLRAIGGTEGMLLNGYLDSRRPITTGYAGIDAAMGGGMRPGMHLLGAAPGTGKSALALNMAMLAAMRGTCVMYMTFEMSASDCKYRCMSCLSATDPGLTPFRWSDVEEMGIGLKARYLDWLRDTQMDAPWSERDRCRDLFLAGVASGAAGIGTDPVVAASRRYEDALGGLAICDGASYRELDRIEELATVAADAGMGLMVIDHLQLVSVAGATDGYERVSEVSTRINSLGLRLGVPVLALSQMNRETNKAGKASDMFGFRGSGSLEADAVSAMTLTRPDDCSWVGHSRPLDLRVVKSRFGTVSDEPIRLLFDGAHNVMDEG